MPDTTVLKDWITGGPRPRRLAPDLILGCIRWKKALGFPKGKLNAAFLIECYHFDRKARNEHQSVHLTVPHVVDSSEGPHDADHFRVTFTTDGRTPRGYEVNSEDPLRKINVLEVRFRTGVSWSNNTFTGRGTKVIVPAQVIFAPSTRAQRLSDIDVIHRIASLGP